MSSTTELPIVWLRCCRPWPIVPYLSWGRCKLCGRRPEEPCDEPSPEEREALKAALRAISDGAVVDEGRGSARR